MDNTFIISITDSAFICTNNTTGCLGVAGFTGNTMSGNIVNIVFIQQHLILANDTANIIATLNSIIVNQRILRATNCRIFCFTNQAADIR